MVFASSSFAQTNILYQNTIGKTGQFYAPPLGTEFGNEVVLAGPTNALFELTSFSCEYNSGTNEGPSVGAVVVHFYQNNGPDFNGVTNGAEPGTLLGTAVANDLPATGVNGDVVTFSLPPGIIVPDTFTWTATFSSYVGASLGLGLDTYGPPVVGQALNDIWQNDGSGWVLYQTDNGVTVSTFGAEVYGNVASPVPVLNIATTGTNSVVVSWTGILGSFQLQQNADLTTQNWVAVTNAPLLFGGQNLVALPATGNGFFRLVSQ
jgi:hypothetical protein